MGGGQCSFILVRILVDNVTHIGLVLPLLDRDIVEGKFSKQASWRRGSQPYFASESCHLDVVTYLFPLLLFAVF